MIDPTWAKGIPRGDHGVFAPSGRTIIERFLALTQPEPNSGCLLWLGYVDEETGYGKFNAGKTVGAHHFSFVTFVGPLGPGLCACHKCDTRVCVNWDHMFPGTRRDNMQDAAKKGRMPRGTSHHCGAKTECKRGHPFDEANTSIGSKGERRCLACLRMHAKNARERS